MNDYLTVVLGSSTDYFYKADEYPKEGEYSHAEIYGMAAGGCPLNVGCVAASKDVRVKALDMLGKNDDSTEFLLDELKRFNVDTSHIVFDENTTNGKVLIINTDDKRTMFVVDPKRPFYTITEDIQNLLNSSRYIYSLMHMIARSFKDTEPLQTARKHGARMIFDGTSKYDNPERRSMLYELADGLFINTTDYQNLVEHSDRDPKEILFENGCEFICITDGSKGAACFTKDNEYHAEALKLDEVIDSTGAGDSFAGTFLASLMMGFSYKKALRYACVSGAYACTVVGGQGGVATYASLKEFAQEHNYDLGE